MPWYGARLHLPVATQPRASNRPVSATSSVPVPPLPVTHDGTSVRFNPETAERVFAIACMDVYAVIIGVPIFEIFFVNEKTIGHVSPRASRLLDLMPVGRLDFVLRMMRDLAICRGYIRQGCAATKERWLGTERKGGGTRGCRRKNGPNSRGQLVRQHRIMNLKDSLAVQVTECRFEARRTCIKACSYMLPAHGTWRLITWVRVLVKLGGYSCVWRT
ncbi:hypothetical protein BDR05DRAFT_958723 [Suillus weaverae]|nr:hypothetical protein BDR05DRAFT_958723 [Suillus weaverae]